MTSVTVLCQTKGFGSSFQCSAQSSIAPGDAGVGVTRRHARRVGVPRSAVVVIPGT